MTFWLLQGAVRKTEEDDRSVARKRREKRERQRSARASAEPWAEAEAVRRNKQVIRNFVQAIVCIKSIKIEHLIKSLTFMPVCWFDYRQGIIFQKVFLTTSQQQLRFTRRV